MLGFLRKTVALDSPLRVAYHFLMALAARWAYLDPARGMVVVGITGTKGKTTVSTLVAEGLEKAGHKVFLFTTASYWIAGERRVNHYKMTSPSPWLLWRLLWRARLAGCTHAVVETSSHALFYHRVLGLQYDLALLTNLSQDHLDLHGTMDAYARVKLRLFSGLVHHRRKPGVKKVSVVNVDHEWAPLFLQETADVVRTFGVAGNAEFRPENVRSLADGMSFDLRLPGRVVTVTTGVQGVHNAANLAGAFCALNMLKVPQEAILETFAAFRGVAGRMEKVPNRFGIHCFVDYAHTESSLEAVLSTVRDIPGRGKVVLVFGATGDRDRSKRPLMGAVAHRLADAVVLTDDDTYTEPSPRILREVAAGIPRAQGEGFWIVPDRGDAIRTALVMAKPGDVVLLAGKGCETVLVTNDGAVPWSDVEEAKKVFAELEDNQIVA